jgi:hypothetical protein
LELERRLLRQQLLRLLLGLQHVPNPHDSNLQTFLDQSLMSHRQLGHEQKARHVSPHIFFKFRGRMETHRPLSNRMPYRPVELMVVIISPFIPQWIVTQPESRTVAEGSSAECRSGFSTLLDNTVGHSIPCVWLLWDWPGCWL